MTVLFYKYGGLKNKIDKVLSNPLTVENVIIKSVYNLTNIEMKLTNDNLDDDYNYCYIQELNRYYFVEKITHNNGGIRVYNLRCDVLTTYATEIKNATAIIRKSANPDNNFVDCEKSNTFTNEVLTLNDNFNHSGNLILVTSIGG